MRIFLKIVLLFIISLLIYLLIPYKSDKLVYIPNIKEQNYETALKLQNIPLNKYDLLILNLYNIKPGWVRVSSNTNKLKLFKELLERKREKTRKIVVYGGDSLLYVSKKIAKLTNLNSTVLLNYFKTLSQYHDAILAGKYDIPYNATERSIAAYILYKSDSFYKKLANNKKIKVNSKKFKEKLIIASIIEKETQNYKEMPIIASVIYNRLKKGIKLQIDATLNYGKNSHKIVTPQLIKKDKSKFNTYKHKGLPPKPIGTVSKAAVISAFKPAITEYLYFVKRPKGGHIFSKEYKEHIAKVKVYKKDLEKKRLKKLTKLVLKNLKIKFPQLIPKFKIVNFKYRNKK